MEINGQRWVDALHLASEIPGFYTRYLASVKEDLGVVVTFSVSQDMYNLYQPVFDKMIKSIRVFRQGTGNLPAAKIAGAGGKSGHEGGLEGSVVVNDDDIINIKKPKRENGSSKKTSASDDYFLLILGGAVVVLFFLAKRRKK